VFSLRLADFVDYALGAWIFFPRFPNVLVNSTERRWCRVYRTVLVHLSLLFSNYCPGAPSAELPSGTPDGGLTPGVWSGLPVGMDGAGIPGCPSMTGVAIIAAC
jgi:hypothetical protein